MLDVITYTDDLTSLRAWLLANKDNWPEINEDGKIISGKVKVYENGDKSVSMIECETLDFINASPLEILAQGERGVVDPNTLLTGDAITKFESVIDRTPIDITDLDTGEVIETVTPPLSVGVFA